jgi:hypothetical protein
MRAVKLVEKDLYTQLPILIFLENQYLNRELLALVIGIEGTF